MMESQDQESSNVPTLTKDCPCCSGKEYSSCCEPLHLGKLNAADPEALMRSRYSAYALGVIDYLPRTIPLIERKSFDRLGATQWSQLAKWGGLEVLSTKESHQGKRAFVEFKAKYDIEGKEQIHHEKAEFRKEQGRWFFIDGRIIEAK